jgi:hypothetical protein
VKAVTQRLVIFLMTSSPPPGSEWSPVWEALARQKVNEKDGPCPSSKLNPHGFIGGLDGRSIACGAWGCRPANHSRSREAADLEPSPRCCWRGSPCATKSPCWSAAELVARAFAVGIGCFGSCYRVGGLNGATA